MPSTVTDRLRGHSKSIAKGPCVAASTGANLSTFSIQAIGGIGAAPGFPAKP